MILLPPSVCWSSSGLFLLPLLPNILLSTYATYGSVTAVLLFTKKISPVQLASVLHADRQTSQCSVLPLILLVTRLLPRLLAMHSLMYVSRLLQLLLVDGAERLLLEVTLTMNVFVFAACIADIVAPAGSLAYVASVAIAGHFGGQSASLFESFGVDVTGLQCAASVCELQRKLPNSGL